MDETKKAELFLHWLVYQSALKIFKQRLTFKQTLHLYHIFTHSKMTDISKRTGDSIKTIKQQRTFIYKKINPKLTDKSRYGKDNIFFNILLNVIPQSINNDFFKKWEFELKEKRRKNKKDIVFDNSATISDLPIGIGKIKKT